MTPTRNGIIVHCAADQKDTISVGGKTFLCALKFGTNYREKSQVLATVIQGNDKISEGAILICHHTLFYGESPWAIGDDLFSIPVNENIFAIIDENGNPHCVGGNILAERVQIEYKGLATPGDHVKPYKDRVVILEDYGTFKKGQQVFTYPNGNYEIIYHWDGEERRVVKIKFSDIVAVSKK